MESNNLLESYVHVITVIYENKNKIKFICFSKIKFRSMKNVGRKKKWSKKKLVESDFRTFSKNFET